MTNCVNLPSKSGPRPDSPNTNVLASTTNRLMLVADRSAASGEWSEEGKGGEARRRMFTSAEKGRRTLTRSCVKGAMGVTETE